MKSVCGLSSSQMSSYQLVDQSHLSSHTTDHTLTNSVVYALRYKYLPGCGCPSNQCWFSTTIRECHLPEDLEGRVTFEELNILCYDIDCIFHNLSLPLCPLLLPLWCVMAMVYTEHFEKELNARIEKENIALSGKGVYWERANCPGVVAYLKRGHIYQVNDKLDQNIIMIPISSSSTIAPHGQMIMMVPITAATVSVVNGNHSEYVAAANVEKNIRDDATENRFV